jgi:hypothetical protein
VTADIVRVEISVALEPPRFVPDAYLASPEWPSVEFRVQADPAETLDDLVARTAGVALRDAFGDGPRSSIYAVWLGSLNSETSTELGEVPVFTADGRLRIVWGGAARIGQLLQAQAAGLLRADPRKVIVRPEPPAAGVDGGGWDIVVEGLHVLWRVVEDIGVTYAAYEALERVLSRFRAGADAIEQQMDEFEGAGIRRPNFHECWRRGRGRGGSSLTPWESRSARRSCSCEDSPSTASRRDVGPERSASTSDRRTASSIGVKL